MVSMGPTFQRGKSARNLHLSIRDVSSVSPNLSKWSNCAKVAVILKLLMLYFVNYSLRNNHVSTALKSAVVLFKDKILILLLCNIHGSKSTFEGCLNMRDQSKNISNSKPQLQFVKLQK